MVTEKGALRWVDTNILLWFRSHLGLLAERGLDTAPLSPGWQLLSFMEATPSCVASVRKFLELVYPFV